MRIAAGIADGGLVEPYTDWIFPVLTRNHAPRCTKALRVRCLCRVPLHHVWGPRFPERIDDPCPEGYVLMERLRRK